MPSRTSASSPSAMASPPPSGDSLTKKRSFASRLQTPSPQISEILLLPPSLYYGELALKLSQAMVEALSKQFQHTLIGKFSHDRSTMEGSLQIFAKLRLKGNFQLGHLDLKHMLNPSSTWRWLQQYLVERDLFAWWISDEDLPLDPWVPPWLRIISHTDLNQLPQHASISLWQADPFLYWPPN